MRNKPFVPKWIFGAGENCEVIGAHWPEVELDEGIRWYFLFQFGHHLQSKFFSKIFLGLVSHLVLRNEGNFWELTIHHFATIFSMMYSYFSNWEVLGMMVLFVSDFADIFLNLGRWYRNTRGNGGSDIFKNSLYIFLLISWAYTRCYQLPACFNGKVWNYLPYFGELEQRVKKEYVHLWYLLF